LIRQKSPPYPKVLVRKPWGCEWTKHSPFAQAVKRREHADGMKNITISMDDDLYREARIKTAEQSTSISALFKNFLIRLTVGGWGN